MTPDNLREEEQSGEDGKSTCDWKNQEEVHRGISSIWMMKWKRGNEHVEDQV